MDRRSFLVGGALLGGNLTGRSDALAAAMARVPALDVHHHMLPPFYKPAALAWLERLGGALPAVANWTPDASVAALDEAGRARAVLSVSAPATTHLSRDAAVDMARRCNDYASELTQRHAGRFRFFASLPMPHVEASLAEATRALGLPGAAGVAVLTSYDGRYLGDPAFIPLLQLLDKLGAIAFVHPTAAPCCVGLTPNVPVPLIEFPVDTARTIAELLWSGALSRYERIQFIFSHGGGVLPMLTERLKLVGLADPSVAARVPEGVDVALRRLYVDTASVTHKGAFAAILGHFDEDRILFGTDYPWGSVDASRAALDRLNLSPHGLERVMARNAERLLQ